MTSHGLKDHSGRHILANAVIAASRLPS